MIVTSGHLAGRQICPSVALLDRTHDATGSANVKQHLHVGLTHETPGIDTIIGERCQKGYRQSAFWTGDAVSGVFLHQVRLAAQLMPRTAQVRMTLVDVALIEVACVQRFEEPLRL